VSSRQRAYLAWLIVCLVWGTTYLAIRIALETIPPLLMAGFRWIVAGLFMGFCRNVVLVWPEIHAVGGRAFLSGIVSIQVACIGWALGSAYARRRGHQENVLGAAALEMLFGGIALLFAGLIWHEWAALNFNARTAGALTYLIVFGSIGGFSAFVYALKHLPIATVSLYSYVNPVIAVALGTLVLGEPFSARTVLASGLVLAGVVIVKTKN
jgi:drug/metabolite transporter (DMT)-like permease